MLGEEAPFVGPAQPLNVFFFSPLFSRLAFCQPSLTRGLRLAAQWLQPEFIDSLLFAHSPSMPLWLPSISSVQRRRSGEEERAVHKGEILHTG